MSREECNDRLLTRKQAAELLGVQPQTLAVWASTGRVALPYVKIGTKAVRYRQSDIDKFVSGGVVSHTVDT